MSKMSKDGGPSARTFGTIGWIAAPVAGIALALWSVAVLSGLGSVGTTLAAASQDRPLGLLSPNRLLSRDRMKFEHEAPQGRRLAGPQARVPLADQTAKSGRLSAAVQAEDTAPEASFDVRFERVVAQAALSPVKLAALFAEKRTVVVVAKNADAATQVSSIVAATASDERFGRTASAAAPSSPAADRFGSQLASVDNAFDLALATVDTDAVDTFDPLVPPSEQLAVEESPSLAEPGLEGMPNSVPLPSGRPRTTTRSAAEPEPSVSKPRTRAAQRSKSPEPRESQPSGPTIRSNRAEGSMLAYARPDPIDDAKGAFKNLFNAPGRKRGVAVYDISAAKVYMPDGSVLEAHSGIGKMADNPRYAHIKMSGPTPPHTYNLKMRETRFHGVEAIRMLPVDGKNKHGRDGFLTHSYLLRGGRAESHGCVAFKDYNKFLNAFKKGKITQLVVVPGRKSRGTQVASNGRDT